MKKNNNINTGYSKESLVPEVYAIPHQRHSVLYVPGDGFKALRVGSE